MRKAFGKRGGGSSSFYFVANFVVEQGLKRVSFVVVVRKKIGTAERDIMTAKKLQQYHPILRFAIPVVQ